MRKFLVLVFGMAMLGACAQKPEEERVPLPMRVEKLLNEKGLENEVRKTTKDPCLLSTIVKDVRFTNPEDFVSELKNRDDIYVLHTLTTKTYYVCRALSKVAFSETYAGCANRYDHLKLSSDDFTLICTDADTKEPGETQLR